MAELSATELLAGLGIEVTKTEVAELSTREERIIAGFAEIQDFVAQHGELPSINSASIFERLYALRLEKIAASDECRPLLAELDYQGLLCAYKFAEPNSSPPNYSELLASLGIDSSAANGITELKHVKSHEQKQREKAEQIGTRTPCEDFAEYKPRFIAVQKDLQTGIRKTMRFVSDSSIEVGNWFILYGQKVLVAAMDAMFIDNFNRRDCRLRLIFDNGVESNMLMRSLQKQLWADDTGRRISDTSYGPLFDDVEQKSGTIYVLRSCSTIDYIAQNREVIHKIGVTGGEVKKRIAAAKDDPTYLLAEVEVVATYELVNIKRSKLEHLLHRFFEAARLQIEILDRFGKPVNPREWFLLPLPIIDQAVELIRARQLDQYQYDPQSASIIKK